MYECYGNKRDEEFRMGSQEFYRSNYYIFDIIGDKGALGFDL